ncbi:MAG TPA: hypothetical protein PKI80_03760 [Deltaproteobacteria bacterium]|nr:hypothetical protein [Deltaproteobacteria bacterium]HNS82730.1 hypothetical protein [Methanolinea sp.]
MGKIVFPRTPICEVCKKEEAVSFSYLKNIPEANIKEGWYFCGYCISQDLVEDYYIEFDRFFHSPASTVDWLAHIAGKKWINWADFMAMMKRFREATGSFNQG